MYVAKVTEGKKRTDEYAGTFEDARKWLADACLNYGYSATVQDEWTMFEDHSRVIGRWSAGAYHYQETVVSESAGTVVTFEMRRDDDANGAPAMETQPMKAHEMGKYVCVAHGGCLHSPHRTIETDGVWVKQAPGGPFSSAHRDCFEAWQARDNGAETEAE